MKLAPKFSSISLAKTLSQLIRAYVARRYLNLKATDVQFSISALVAKSRQLANYKANKGTEI